MEHGSGVPKASCNFHNASEELDATFESGGLIVEAQADYLLTLKDNTASQLDKVNSMRWRSHQV